jgi:hypothetical protein
MTYEERQQRLRQIAHIRSEADRLERELIDGTTAPPSGYATPPPMQNPAQRTAVGRVYERLASNARLTPVAPAPTTTAEHYPVTQNHGLAPPQAMLAGARQAPVHGYNGKQLFSGLPLVAPGDQFAEHYPTTPHNGLAPPQALGTQYQQQPDQQFHGYPSRLGDAPLAVQKLERIRAANEAKRKAATVEHAIKKAGGVG